MNYIMCLESPYVDFCDTSVMSLGKGAGNLKLENVLDDDKVREGVEVFSNWPTIPQLYINAEIVGGCDIIVDLYESGELQKMLTTTAN